MNRWLIGLGALAVASIATEARAQCEGDNDCRAGRVCNDGECVSPSCSKDTDCPADAICNEGRCEATPEGQSRGVPQPDAAPPPDAPVMYRTETSGIMGLYIAGPILLGASWLITLSFTAALADEASRDEAMGYAAIPIVGPWVMLGSDLDTADYEAALVVSGVLQSSGLIMTVLGLSIRREEQVPVGPTIHVAPAVGPGVGALWATGSF